MVRTWCFHCHGPGSVPAGKLRSHKLHCAAKKERKKERKKSVKISKRDYFQNIIASCRYDFFFFLVFSDFQIYNPI